MLNLCFAVLWMACLAMSVSASRSSQGQQRQLSTMYPELALALPSTTPQLHVQAFHLLIRGACANQDMSEAAWKEGYRTTVSHPVTTPSRDIHQGKDKQPRIYHFHYLF